MTTADNLEFAQQIASTSSNITVNQFHRYARDESLVLRPAFQRNLVWNREQQSFLVDSILRGLPVPEIYVQFSTSHEGEERVIVVDGQQRISACLAFLTGNLRLVGDRDLDARWRNRVFSEIEQELQARFRGYELIVRKLPDLGEAVLREIFRRLNKTVEPLTPQELRHAAYTGPFIKFVETAAARPVLSELGVFTARDYLRRRSDELIAEIALAVNAGAYPNKKEGLDELFLTFERQGVPEGVLDNLGARFGRSFVQLEPMAGALRRTRFRNKSDFYTLFIALAKNAESLPLSGDATEQLESVLRDFATTVDNMKRDEGDGRGAEDIAERPGGMEAIQYLRAVERAASDRLSRVRRDEALQAVIGPALARGEVRKLSASDASWLTETPDESEDSDDDDSAIERAHAQDVLTTAGDVAGHATEPAS